MSTITLRFLLKATERRLVQVRSSCLRHCALREALQLFTLVSPYLAELRTDLRVFASLAHAST